MGIKYTVGDNFQVIFMSRLIAVVGRLLILLLILSFQFSLYVSAPSKPSIWNYFLNCFQPAPDVALRMIWRQIIQLSFLKASLPCFDKTQIMVLMVPDFTSLLSCLCQVMVFPLQALGWHRVSMLSARFNIPTPPNRLPFSFFFFFKLTAFIAADSNEETSTAMRSNHLIFSSSGVSRRNICL